MKIGDIEYTRKGQLTHGAASTSTILDLSFAVGIKVRALMTRIQVFIDTAAAVTNGTGVFFENSQNQPAGVSVATLLSNANLFPIHFIDTGLSTNGIGQTFPFESLWWKILMPEVRLHFASSVSALGGMTFNLHYRFAELTDDEIVEIAAQRSVS